MNPIQIVIAADLNPIFPSAVQTHYKIPIQKHVQKKIGLDKRRNSGEGNDNTTVVNDKAWCTWGLILVLFGGIL